MLYKESSMVPRTVGTGNTSGHVVMLCVLQANKNDREAKLDMIRDILRSL